MGIYEVVESQDDAKLTSRPHRPLSATKSAPGDSPAPIEVQKPKIVARKAAHKDPEALQLSRDRSPVSTYREEDDDSSSKVVGVVELAPAPAPRRWKRLPNSDGVTGLHSVNGHGDVCKVEDGEEVEVEDEDFYSIPPDAGGPEVSDIVETKPLESALGAFKCETVQDEGVADDLLPESVVSGNLDVEQPSTVEDGRASSSSMVRECLAELDNLQSKSSRHVMVNIDVMREREQDDDEENKEDNQHSYKNQEIIERREQNDDEINEDKQSLYINQEIAEPREQKDEEEEDKQHVYINQKILELRQGDGENSKDEERIVAEDLPKTIADPDVAVGHHEEEVKTSRSLSLVDEVMGHFSQRIVESAPDDLVVESAPDDQLVESAPDDLTYYDLQTVSHPPVTTNEQGYSYCDIRRDLTSTNATSVQNHSQASNTAPTDESAYGYSEIDVLSPTEFASKKVADSHHSPHVSPRPLKRDVGLESNDRDSSSGSIANPSSDIPCPTSTNHDMCDDDLYAQVLDVDEVERKVNVPSKMSPKPRKKQLTGNGKRSPKGSPKGARKSYGPPRRRPPPPPPKPIAENPPNGSTHSLASEGASLTPPSAQKISPSTEWENRFEQSLPPLPSRHSGSPHRTTANPVDDFAAMLNKSLASFPPPQAESPKLPGRKGPLPPSPSQVEPPSPSQRLKLFSRGKSGSMKSKKSEQQSSPSSPLTDEVSKTDRKGEQSGKFGWKQKFRFRRGSAGVSNGGSAMPPSEGSIDSVTTTESSDVGTRRRRKREDKLPDVPDSAKSLSLPSPSHLGASSGVHVHPYEGDEEEEEDELYSVVNKPEKIPPKVSACTKHLFIEFISACTMYVCTLQSSCMLHTCLVSCTYKYTLTCTLHVWVHVYM